MQSRTRKGFGGGGGREREGGWWWGAGRGLWGEGRKWRGFGKRERDNVSRGGKGSEERERDEAWGEGWGKSFRDRVSSLDAGRSFGLAKTPSHGRREGRGFAGRECGAGWGRIAGTPGAGWGQKVRKQGQPAAPPSGMSVCPHHLSGATHPPSPAPSARPPLPHLLLSSPLLHSSSPAPLPSPAPHPCSLALHNLVLLLCHLYACGVIRSEVVYSFLGVVRNRLSEPDVDMIVSVLGHVGLQLRGENPAQMKEFVLGVHARAAELGQKGASGGGRVGGGSSDACGILVLSRHSQSCVTLPLFRCPPSLS